MSALAILVSQKVRAKYGEAIVAVAAEHEVELFAYDGPKPLDREERSRIVAALLSVDIMGDSTKAFTDPRLEAFSQVLLDSPGLRWLQVCSSGMDRAIYGELAKRGVRLSSATGVNAGTVAQSAIAGMLALSRRIPQWLEAQKAHRWQPLRGASTPADFASEHVAVVGTGAIGCSIAEILKAMRLRVTGVRRAATPLPFFDEVLPFDRIDEIVPKVDWLVLACPLTDITRGLVDRRRLAAMRPNAHLVNVSRGAVVDEEALVDALRDRSIAGAYLDVFTVEPLPATSPLWDLPNVLLSAHSAGNFAGHQRRLMELFERNLPRFLRGDRVENEQVVA